MAKLIEVARALVGGLSVYVAMAACAQSAPGDDAATSSEATGGSAGKAGSSMMNPVPEAQAKSGTRLRAKVMTGADGSSSVVPGTWYDSQRKEECVFTETPAGTRCMPIPGAGVSGFADAACSKPLGLASQCATAPKYGSAYVDCSTSKFYSLQATSVAQVYVVSGSTCAKVATSPGTSYFTATEVNYADFVAGTTSYE